jgi:hypothetical protein
MSFQAAFIRWLAIQVNEEIKKRDREIDKLKTALAGAQEENRKLWELIEKHRDVIGEELM